MSDSQRSWIGVKGWLDDKSSQISRRLVPRVRRISKQTSSTMKDVPSLPMEPKPSREDPPKESAPLPAKSSRNSEWRMSSSSRFNSKENSNTQYLDQRPPLSTRSKPSRASSVIEPVSRPTPRVSKRHSSSQQTIKSASARTDDVDSKLSRRRSNTNESLLVQNRKVTSDRQERREAKVYSDDVRRPARGIEPSRPAYPDNPPASRGRSTQGSTGGTVALEGTVGHDIKAAREHPVDTGNIPGPPQSSMSRRSSARPESISYSSGIGKLIKRRHSHVEHSHSDELARQMKGLKLSREDSRGRILSRGRSRSRSRSRSHSRDPLHPGRRPSRREEVVASLQDEKRRGRSLSRSSRFSSKSRSVDRRKDRIDPHTESKSRGAGERRGSITVHTSGDPSQHHIMVTRDGRVLREDGKGASVMDTVIRQRPRSRSPSKNSLRRRLSRTPSRGSLHPQAIEVQHDGRTRRASNASDHASPNGITVARDPGSRNSIMMRPGSSTRSIAGDTRAPTTTTSHSSSRNPTKGDADYADDENEARRRRRNSTNSITDGSTRVSPTDPRASGMRGILRRTGRSSTFTDGLPPRVPPPTSTSIRPKPKIRRSSRSRSRSPGGGGPSDDELRSNTMHNARNLKYQPHRDGYPSSTSPSSGHRRAGLVPVRYPVNSGPPRTDGHLPLRRYTTSSVGGIAPISMPRRPSYPIEYPLAMPPAGTGAGDWYPGISPTHEYYTEPYGYGAYPGSYPGSAPLGPSHAQYPSWPPDMRGAFPPRRQG